MSSARFLWGNGLVKERPCLSVACPGAPVEASCLLFASGLISVADFSVLWILRGSPFPHELGLLLESTSGGDWNYLAFCSASGKSSQAMWKVTEETTVLPFPS